MPPSIRQRLAKTAPAAVDETFYRHAAAGRQAFAGGDRGRWGEDFPVIYLATSFDGAVVEAYRHLIEPYGISRDAIQPRQLYVVRVQVGSLLDLTSPHDLACAGLDEADLTSEVDDYARCQEVAAAAHQLGRHGILAPAAHGLGATLALFKDQLVPSELPRVQQKELWLELPPDPRDSNR